MGKREYKLKKKEQKLKYKLAKKELKTGEEISLSWYKKLLKEGFFQIVIKVIAALIAAFILWKLGLK